jgi:hypothetical protein
VRNRAILMVYSPRCTSLGTGVALGERVIEVTVNFNDLIAGDLCDQPAMDHADPTIGALEFNGLNGHDFLPFDKG